MDAFPSGQPLLSFQQVDIAKTRRSAVRGCLFDTELRNWKAKVLQHATRSEIRAQYSCSEACKSQLAERQCRCARSTFAGKATAPPVARDRVAQNPELTIGCPRMGSPDHPWPGWFVCICIACALDLQHILAVTAETQCPRLCEGSAAFSTGTLICLPACSV